MKVPILKSLSENKEFLYAVVLILLIPGLLLLNAFLFIRGVNDTFDTELTSKANLATNVLGSVVKDSLDDSDKLRSAIKDIEKNAPEIIGLSILSFENNVPIVRATNEGKEALSNETTLLTKLAWTTQQTYTTRVEALNEKAEPITLWQVSLPILEEVATPSAGENKTDVKGTSLAEATSSATATTSATTKAGQSEKETLAVVNLKVSGEKSSTLISNLERNSIIVALITLAVVVLLLLNHFRFFGYARLFTRLREVDEMKDNFISLASHELRTPVGALRGFASLAVKHFKSGNQDTAVKDMDKVNKAAEGIEALVNDLLDVSRIEQKRLKLDIQNVSLVQTLAEVIEQLQAQATEKELALTYTKPAEDFFLSADQQKLKQIFVNIIGNSIKYTPHGNVEVYHETEGNKIKTLVKDTGVGIPAKEIPNLFQKFHRVRSEKTSGIRGTGLGLWITKQLTQIMNGEIFVESIENTGTKVVIVFPYVKKPIP